MRWLCSHTTIAMSLVSLLFCFCLRVYFFGDALPQTLAAATCGLSRTNAWVSRWTSRPKNILVPSLDCDCHDIFSSAPIRICVNGRREADRVFDMLVSPSIHATHAKIVIINRFLSNPHRTYFWHQANENNKLQNYANSM